MFDNAGSFLSGRASRGSGDGATLLSALGFSGPFDVDHSTPQLAAGSSVLERVLATPCVQDWAQHFACYKSCYKSEPKSKWDNRAVGEVLRAVFHAADLKLVSKLARKRQGSDPRENIYHYKLEPSSVEKMRDLVALREGRTEMVQEWQHLL